MISSCAQRCHSAIAVIVVTVLSACAPQRSIQSEQTLQRIAFGSCASQYDAQPIWTVIAATQPDLFIFAGDAIYADYDGQQLVDVSPESLKRAWARLAGNADFAAFRRSTQIMATWDNHDYGAHDGGADFPLKEVSKSLFLDFFGEPVESARRQLPGIYSARAFGDDRQRVQVILLDTRSFRSPSMLASGRDESASGSLGKFVPHVDSSATLLGEQQWEWLERQLGEPARIRLIVSGNQIIPDQKGMDEWGNFPHERQRLLALLRTTNAQGVILLSGNVHFAEIAVLDREGTYPLIEFTSSGLTHTDTAYANAPNRYRLRGPFDDLNFGLLEIDWNASPAPIIKLKAVGNDGRKGFSYELSLADLRSLRQHR